MRENRRCKLHKKLCFSNMKTSDKIGSGQRREEERCQKRTLVIDLLNPAAAAAAVDDDDEEVGAACPLLHSQRG